MKVGVITMFPSSDLVAQLFNIGLIIDKQAGQSLILRSIQTVQITVHQKYILKWKYYESIQILPKKYSDRSQQKVKERKILDLINLLKSNEWFIKILAPIPVGLEIGVQYSQIWDLEASRELLISVSPYTAQTIHPFYKFIYSFTKKFKLESTENILILH
jgi:hypothetical protein